MAATYTRTCINSKSKYETFTDIKVAANDGNAAANTTLFIVHSRLG